MLTRRFLGAVGLTAAGVIATCLALAGAFFSSDSSAAVGGSWTTYHHDATRYGVDPDQSAFDTITQAWRPITLDGSVFAEPLIVGNQVLVATENNSVYSFDIGTGAQLWAQTQLAPPIMGGLPCGNIVPTGITSTPVVDTPTGLLYAAMSVGTPSPHYELAALDINHAVLCGFGYLSIQWAAVRRSMRQPRGSGLLCC